MNLFTNLKFKIMLTKREVKQRKSVRLFNLFFVNNEENTKTPLFSNLSECEAKDLLQRSRMLHQIKYLDGTETGYFYGNPPKYLSVEEDIVVFEQFDSVTDECGYSHQIILTDADGNKICEQYAGDWTNTNPCAAFQPAKPVCKITVAELIKEKERAESERFITLLHKTLKEMLKNAGSSASFIGEQEINFFISEITKKLKNEKK